LTQVAWFEGVFEAHLSYRKALLHIRHRLIPYKGAIVNQNLKNCELSTPGDAKLKYVVKLDGKGVYPVGKRDNNHF
jgi:hypothetical protein